MNGYRRLAWLTAVAAATTPLTRLAHAETTSTPPPRADAVRPIHDAPSSPATTDTDDAASVSTPPPAPSDSQSVGGPSEPALESNVDASRELAPDSASLVATALEEAVVDLDIDALVLPADALELALGQRTEAASGGVASTWLVGYRVTPLEGALRLEVTAVPPDSNVQRVVVESTDETRLQLRAMVLLREAVRLQARTAPPAAPPAPENPSPPSSGRAGLALNGALLGGYIGVSLQQASNSEDDRLLYPLAALGVGLGLGASMLIADEWDITTEDAWYISAGLLWPAVSGSLIAASYDVEPEHRYLYGLSGAAVGATLAGVAVARGGVHTGSAAIAHSGGAFGQGLGALTEGLIEGNLDGAPLRGMGYGSGVGVLAAGVLATQVETSPSRVLLVDLAALLGGLTGGALATPLLLGEHVDDTRRRLWFGAVGLGTFAGAALGILATDDEAPSTSALEFPRLHPYAGVIGVSVRGSERVPVYGGGVSGDF